MNILITLGSQKFQFNRLLEAIDEQIEQKKIQDDLFAQIGYSDYKPQKYLYCEFLNHDEFVEQMERADIVITHGGTGAIISAVKKEKKVIAVPRLSKYGEHVDDHQIQIVEQFKELGLIEECIECSMLWSVIQDIKEMSFKKYESNTARIINDIEEYINSQS